MADLESMLDELEHHIISHTIRESFANSMKRKGRDDIAADFRDLARKDMAEIANLRRAIMRAFNERTEQ